MSTGVSRKPQKQQEAGSWKHAPGAAHAPPPAATAQQPPLPACAAAGSRPRQLSPLQLLRGGPQQVQESEERRGLQLQANSRQQHDRRRPQSNRQRPRLPTAAAVLRAAARLPAVPRPPPPLLRDRLQGAAGWPAAPRRRQRLPAEGRRSATAGCRGSGLPELPGMPTPPRWRHL